MGGVCSEIMWFGHIYRNPTFEERNHMSFGVVRVFSSAIRKANFPDFITGKVEYLKLSVLGKYKEQVASLPVQTSIGYRFVLQMFLQLAYRIN
jgi:hypothetical protein